MVEEASIDVNTKKVDGGTCPYDGDYCTSITSQYITTTQGNSVTIVVQNCDKQCIRFKLHEILNAE